MLIHWILTVLCLILAAFFRLALVGYGTLSVLFFCAALVLACFGVLSLLRRRGRAPRAVRILRRALLVCLALGLALFCALEGFVLSGARTDAAEADYLIVLGAAVNGTVPSLSLRERLEAARDYLNAHPDCVAVLSGGQGPGEQISEAECMFRWLTAAGIPAERLIRESEATTTGENIQFSLALIEQRDDPERAEIAIVSNEYHLYRAKAMAAALGVTATGVAGESTLPLLKVNYFIREAFALLHFAVFKW